MEYFIMNMDEDETGRLLNRISSVNSNRTQSSILQAIEKQEEGLKLYVRKIMWHIPVILYCLFTLQFIESLFRYKHNYVLIRRNKWRFELTIKRLRHYLMRILQIGMVLTVFAQLLYQLILFINDSIKMNKKCCNSTSLNTGITEEVMFASDFIDSIVSLSSCYFIYVNSNIFAKFKIKFRNPMTKSKFLVWKLPRGKGKFFSRIGIVLAYATILLLPVAMVACLTVEQINNLGSVNAYLELFPILLSSTACPTENELKNTTTTIPEEQVYNIMSYAVTLHWHICPVFACIAVRYLCKELEYKVDKAIRTSTEYIINEWKEGSRTQRQKYRPIVKYYKLTSKVEEGSKIAHYIATINIVAVIVILANLFSEYVDSSNRAYTQAFENLTKAYGENHIRTAFIYVYQFISVWILSDAIISLNRKLEKFTDSILSDSKIMEILFTSNERKENRSLEHFKSEMKQELSFISQSRDRFEIAFFGDFSLSVFHTIIPLGVGAMINLGARAIDKIFRGKC